MGAAVYSCHRTVGTEKQRVNVILENADDISPENQYYVCRTCVNDLKLVVGVSSTEDFVKDSFTLGSTNNETLSVSMRCNILATFKTNNSYPKYVTIPINGVLPRLSSTEPFGGVHTAINTAIANMVNNSGGTTSDWIMVSCNLHFYKIGYSE